MIPRLKPYLGKDEFLALFRSQPEAVVCFEAAFAQKFEARHAIAFPYGRSALWTFFKALGIEGAEVIQPAYTCVVVAHATVLSGNIPRFVDITLHDYNMDLDQVADAINERTRAIVATHLFGYPLDLDRLEEIVRTAEARYGHKIWVVQDCAHSFGARWKGRLVCGAGDLSLFGLNISKMITSIFGGMLTTDDPDLARRLRSWRDAYFLPPSWTKSLRRRLYLLTIYSAFHEALYGLAYWLQEETSLLDSLTKAYHLDEKVHFPPDYLDRMLNVEAQVGLAQLDKYDTILRRRRENAELYNEQLQGIPDFRLPPLVDGATYSHYVVLVKNRLSWMHALARRGVQLGQLIEYSVPHMPAYLSYAQGKAFPNSLLCSQRTINLPVHASLRSRQLEDIVRHLRKAMTV